MLKLLMIAFLSSTALCKSVSQKTDTSDMGVYISSITSHTKIIPVIDPNPKVIDETMIDDGDGNDNEDDGTDNDNDINDINDNNNNEDNWW